MFFKRKTEWISQDSNLLAMNPRHRPFDACGITPLAIKSRFLVLSELVACSQFLQARLWQVFFCIHAVLKLADCEIVCPVAGENILILVGQL